jgi:hypothetical protein
VLRHSRSALTSRAPPHMQGIRRSSAAKLPTSFSRMDARGAKPTLSASESPWLLSSAGSCREPHSLKGLRGVGISVTHVRGVNMPASLLQGRGEEAAACLHRTPTGAAGRAASRTPATAALGTQRRPVAPRRAHPRGVSVASPARAALFWMARRRRPTAPNVGRLTGGPPTHTCTRASSSC